MLLKVYVLYIMVLIRTGSISCTMHRYLCHSVCKVTVLKHSYMDNIKGMKEWNSDQCPNWLIKCDDTVFVNVNSY